MSAIQQNPIREQAALHRVLSNTSRLLILRCLAENELSVGKIAETINASLQNTSQHLRLMKDKGILATRRDGQTIFYKIAATDIGRQCKRMLICYETKD